MVILIPYQLMGFSTTSAFPSLELRADFLFAALCLRVKYASINLLGHSQGTNWSYFLTIYMNVAKDLIQVLPGT